MLHNCGDEHRCSQQLLLVYYGTTNTCFSGGFRDVLDVLNDTSSGLQGRFILSTAPRKAGSSSMLQLLPWLPDGLQGFLWPICHQWPVTMLMTWLPRTTATRSRRLHLARRLLGLKLPGNELKSMLEPLEKPPAMAVGELANRSPTAAPGKAAAALSSDELRGLGCCGGLGKGGGALVTPSGGPWPAARREMACIRSWLLRRRLVW